MCDLESWLGRQDAAAKMAADRNSARVIRLRYDSELRGTIPQERDTHTVRHTQPEEGGTHTRQVHNKEPVKLSWTPFAPIQHIT